MSYIMYKGKKYAQKDAKNIYFDNSNTDLESTNVQDSIIEVNKNLNDSLNGLKIGKTIISSATSNEYGNILIPHEQIGYGKIISAHTSSQYIYIIPYSNTMLHIGRDDTGNTVLPNTTIHDITIYYIY